MKKMYPIENISQKEDDGSIDIYFTIADFSFVAGVSKPFEGSPKHRVGGVFHLQRGECPLCKQYEYSNKCSVLERRIESLFEKLISTNSLRLEWLYREYEMANLW